MPIIYSPVIVALTIVASVTGAPSRGFSNPFRDANDMGYSETVLDPFGEPRTHNYHPRIDGDLMRLERTSLDSLSGATFGQSKKYDSRTLAKSRMMGSKPVKSIRVFLPKRNFDEIDRTNFDSFVKKNYIQVPKGMMQPHEPNNLNESDEAFGGVINFY